MMSSESMAAFNAAAEQPDQEDSGRPYMGMLFTGDSITEILAGEKNQTRRLVGPGSIRPGWNRDNWNRCVDLPSAWVDPGPSPAGNPGPYLKVKLREPGAAPDDFTVQRFYPVHFPGDIVYVKETWGCPVADHPRCYDPQARKPKPGDKIVYRQKPADAYQWNTADPRVAASFGWRSPLLMPRWVARIFLEITRVRFERVQDITYADAWWEGCRPPGVPRQPGDGTQDPPDAESQIVELYRQRWDSLHRKPETTWADNPWVIVYDFKRVDP